MPPRAVRIRSLAKINLDLRVLYKRPDGFHELRTIFQTISLADSLSISLASSRQTKLHLDSEIPDNLILRAAELVLAAAKRPARIDFSLQKRIPLGGGLGGGSSNAAAILLALPVLLGVRLSLESLLDLASQLGSDVPFFLFGGAALGIGRGVELYPVPEPPSSPAILIAPGMHLSTPEAYRGLNRKSSAEEPPANLESFQALVWDPASFRNAHYRQVINDFETVVFQQHPQLQSIKGKLLKSGAMPALMSGSGSTLFGIFADRERRDRAVSRLREEFGKQAVHAVSLVSRARYRSLWWRQLDAHLDGRTWPPRSRYTK